MRAACTLLAILAVSASASTQPTFSSRVDGIRVDVLVTDSTRRPVRDLTAGEFSIRDNGIPQQVDVVSYGDVALNVGLAFDLSESVAGARLEQLRTASKALSAELRPADQSALITFDEVVLLRCPLSLDRGCIDRELAAAAPRGRTALIDGILAGLIAGESDVGRSLLMVFSDGFDTASFLGAERVLEMGRRSDVVVYPITSKGTRPDFVEDLATVTGGRLHEVNRTDDLSSTFRTILDEFRHRYLVTYTPRNVVQGGWHTLDVRVSRPGARVKARPGYRGH